MHRPDRSALPAAAIGQPTLHAAMIAVLTVLGVLAGMMAVPALATSGVVELVVDDLNLGPLDGAEVDATGWYATFEPEIGTADVRRVRFYVDGELVKGDFSAPYTWVATDLTQGTHELRARTNYRDGTSRSTSATFAVTRTAQPAPTPSSTPTPPYDSHLPSLIQAATSDGAVVALDAAQLPTDGWTIRVTPGEDAPSRRIRAYIDGDLVGGDRTLPYVVNPPALAPGTHDVRVKTVYSDGHSHSTSAAVHVTTEQPSEDTEPPGNAEEDATRIITPGQDHSWARDDEILIRGSSVDTAVDGSGGAGVATVEVTVLDTDTRRYLTAGGTVDGVTPTIFEATIEQRESTAPDRERVTWRWQLGTRLPLGEYLIQARAVDSAGNVEARRASVRVAVGGGTTPAMVTIVLGRTQYTQHVNSGCTGQYANDDGRMLNLDEVAARLQARDPAVPLTGSVVLDQTEETTRVCTGTLAYASWDDLARYRDQAGWSFISQGKTYMNVVRGPYPATSPHTGEIVTDAHDEICGSLDLFVAHGHDDAWGMFAYPNNRLSNAVQHDVTSTCFGFGRRYFRGTNVEGRQQAGWGGTVLSTNHWYNKTISVSGGTCRDTVSCEDVAPKTYFDTAHLRRLADVEHGLWVNLQFYRFVEGHRVAGDGVRWDCRGDGPTFWEKHWTSHTELFCWNDFEDVIDAIPEHARIVNPATVATSWGRDLGRKQ